MPNLDNILSKLKDHAVSPPPAVFDAIQQELAGEKAEALANAPLENISALRDKAIEPPAFLLDNIVAAGIKQPSTKIVPFRRYIIAIAAALLLIGGIAILLKFAGKKDQQKVDLAVSPSADASKDTAIAEAHPAGHLNPGVIPVFETKRSGSNYQQRSTASVDGDDFTLLDNDLFYSFTNFKYNDLPAFITNDNDEAVKVRVDHSTSITLSEGMVAMMKRMYQQKRNGKPTGKARREKRKLQRWKNADANFFDKNVEKNPMDPLDLAEFIF